MKVLWVASAYPWPGNPYGGIFFQTQAQALARLGVDLALEVTMPWIPSPLAWLSERHAQQRLAPGRQLDGAIPVQRLRYFGHRFQDYFGWPHRDLTRRILDHLPFRPDLIHAHFAYPMGLAAVRAARRLGVPSVITLHGSDVNVSPDQCALGARRFRLAVAGADRVLCVSGALGERTARLTGVQPICLPIGIDLRRFPSALDQAQARAALELPAGRPIVLSIGFLHPSKGVELALEALRHPDLAGALGLFVGNGPLGPAIAASANGLWRQGVPNARIADYLAAADLLILPSYAEGLPTVLVEAGACGTPVIATSVGGIPELLGGDRGRLIPPGSAAALRTAILELLREPEPARRRAALLRAHVAAGFDADRQARELLDIYRTLLPGAAPRGLPPTPR